MQRPIYIPTKEEVKRVYRFAALCFGWHLSPAACVLLVTYSRKNVMVGTFKDTRMNTIIKQIGVAYREVMDY